jgi:hypothetical protein
MPKSLRINIAEVPDFAVGGNLQRVSVHPIGSDFQVLEKGAAHIADVLRKSGKASDVDTTISRGGLKCVFTSTAIAPQIWV